MIPYEGCKQIYNIWLGSTFLKGQAYCDVIDEMIVLSDYALIVQPGHSMTVLHSQVW